MAYLLDGNTKYCKYTHTSDVNCDTTPPSWGPVTSEKEFSPCDPCPTEEEQDWTVKTRPDGTCYAEKIECVGPCDPACCPDPPSEPRPTIAIPDSCCDDTDCVYLINAEYDCTELSWVRTTRLLVGCLDEDEQGELAGGIGTDTWFVLDGDGPRVLGQQDCVAGIYVVGPECSPPADCDDPDDPEGNIPEPDLPDTDPREWCCDTCLYTFRAEIDCETEPPSWSVSSDVEVECLEAGSNLLVVLAEGGDPAWELEDDEDLCSNLIWRQLGDSCLGGLADCDPPPDAPTAPSTSDWPIDEEECCARVCAFEYGAVYDCESGTWSLVDNGIPTYNWCNDPENPTDNNAVKPISRNKWSLLPKTINDWECSAYYHKFTDANCEQLSDCFDVNPTPPDPPPDDFEPWPECCEQCVWRYVAEITDCRKDDGDPDLWEIIEGPSYIGCLDAEEREDLPQEWSPIDDEEEADPCKRHIYVFDRQCDPGGGSGSDGPPSSDDTCQPPPAEPPDLPEEGKPSDCCGECVWLWEASYNCEDGWELDEDTAACHGCFDEETIANAYVFDTWLGGAEPDSEPLSEEDCDGWLYERGEGCKLASGCKEGPDDRLDDCRADDTAVLSPPLPDTDPEDFCCEECVTTWRATWECDASPDTEECECGDAAWVVEFVSTECIEVPDGMVFDEWVETGPCEREYRIKGDACDTVSDCETPPEPDPPDESEPEGCECGDVEFEIVGGDGHENAWWLETSCFGHDDTCPGCPGGPIGSVGQSGWGSGLDGCNGPHPLGTFKVRNCCDEDITIEVTPAPDATVTYGGSECGISGGGGGSLTIPAGTGTVDIAEGWSANILDRQNRGGFVASVSDLPTDCPDENNGDDGGDDNDDDPP